jgi:hypothetical protein
MSLLFSPPLGIMFGLATWAAVRGRGGLFGLVLFTFFASVAAFAGGLAAEAIAGSASDAITGVGAAVGAAFASLVEAVGFGIPSSAESQSKADRTGNPAAVASLSEEAFQ